MKSAFKLALLTGARGEELIEMKWRDIRYDETGEMKVIEVPDYKVSRATGSILSDEDYEMKSIPITYELKELLIELGFQKLKNTAKYIIAPEDKAKRSHLIVLISKAFNHFYSLLGTGEIKTLKHLRKTYITAVYELFGSHSNIITGHSNISIMQKHYIDSTNLIENARKNLKILE